MTRRRAGSARGDSPGRYHRADGRRHAIARRDWSGWAPTPAGIGIAVGSGVVAGFVYGPAAAVGACVVGWLVGVILAAALPPPEDGDADDDARPPW